MFKSEYIKTKIYSLSQSKFRSSFHLNNNMKNYVKDKGLTKIKSDAYDFINKRIAPAIINNDGKQTPMKANSHPIFIAQHACACCCRGCLEKWHHIPKGRELTTKEKDYIVNLLIEWIKKEMENNNE